MARPTIPDLAKAAGVSRSTVSRVINSPDDVRAVTRWRVAEAAAEIGFLGLDELIKSLKPGQRPFRLRIFLQQPNKWFCDTFARAIHAARDEIAHIREIRLSVEHLTDLSPDAICERVRTAAARADAIVVLAAEHPLLTAAIEDSTARGTPVYAAVTTLSCSSLAGYVGLDGHKVGRTAAWALQRLCDNPQKIGVLVGSPRYRVHEYAESGFRSYFRENRPSIRLLEPLPTFESDGIAREMTEKLLTENPDLSALYLSAGGTKGALDALRDSGRANTIATIAYDLTDTTRQALLDGTVDLVISHPFEEIARQVMDVVLGGSDAVSKQSRVMRYIDFKVFTPENI